MRNLFDLSAYQFELPQELIAQVPCTPRDRARMMVIEKASGRITNMVFRDLVDLLNAGDRLIFNDTKVIPARLIGQRESGGVTEVFLTRYRPDGTWEALLRPGKKLRKGSRIHFGQDFFCEVLNDSDTRLVRFHHGGPFETLLQKYGQVPLPQYIKRAVNPTLDPERYQTVYATSPGAVAAPTAGLHFTEEMLEVLYNKGIQSTTVTLHVGLGTFRPVQTEDIREHSMHTEQVIISPEASAQLNQLQKGKLICVGTTSCRALESVVTPDRKIPSGTFDTNIFIYPGYKFRHTQALLTNFHLPGSTLLMLVSAFAGYDLIREAYAKAIQDRYRFFSYGDAMLIL